MKFEVKVTELPEEDEEEEELEPRGNEVWEAFKDGFLNLFDIREWNKLGEMNPLVEVWLDDYE